MPKDIYIMIKMVKINYIVFSPINLHIRESKSHIRNQDERWIAFEFTTSNLHLTEHVTSSVTKPLGLCIMTIE